MLRRSAFFVIGAVGAVVFTAAGAVPAVAADVAGRGVAACATGWGSLAKNDWASTAGESVTGVRIGTHECYDRFVVDVPGAAAARLGYTVRYVDRLVGDPSGEVVPVAGGAILEVIVRAPAYDPETGTPTYPGPAPKPVGYPTFRDAVYAGSFEGQSQFGVGVRARLPFRVLQLDGRLVVDVAHTW
ncbi:hypothetical protein ABZX85_25385 [Streptomyces sp. NPDC004539]|uniref:AMIN-like domain-containing (lipo)protein n=1 Tax=Streptomyces sp. NPDC004539 TaxID=3154280 RepID=UPI0033A2C225